MTLTSRLAWAGVWLVLISSSCSMLGRRAPADDNPWAKVQTPSKGNYGPVGKYTAGCLDGASTLPIDGTGYQAMRVSRNRYYGHADLIQYIQNLGKQSLAQHVGVILIGDMAQPRGGPLPSSHDSHQIGLDADIWYWINPTAQTRPLTWEEREKLEAISLVDLEKYEIDRTQWKPVYTQLIKLAASQPGVERIFVHAAIKKELCETTKGDRSWLQKLRPWYYHHDHFHVRLKCPDGDTRCEHQDPVPPGDGCSGPDFDWWFSDEAKNAQKPGGESAEPKKLPVLPAECDLVLQDP